jgi:hypothetical protein
MCEEHALSGNATVPINETYKNYKPRVNVGKTVRKLLDRVPPEYTRGLSCVVLTNLSGQPRRSRLGKATSRGRRIPASRIAGPYHQQWKGQPPWIELYVDQILRRWQSLPMWIPFLRDLAVARVLYHELGHHVHLFIRPEYREKEDVADAWRDKFIRIALRRKYWYLIPFFKLLEMILASRTDRPTKTH